jgi:hypothetical protein
MACVLRQPNPATLSSLGTMRMLVSCWLEWLNQLCSSGSLRVASCRCSVHCTLVVALTAAAAHALHTLAHVVKRVF